MDNHDNLLRSIFADLDGKRMPYEQTFYPPRPLWGPLASKEVLGFWQARDRVRSQPVSRIYIHIPFCESICRFCGFNAVRMRDGAQVEQYLAALKKEMRRVAGRTRHMKFNQVCMGGGTPSLLTPRQFRELFAVIYSCFNIDKEAKGFGIEIECHPDTLTVEKIQAMAECGITHVALGIQSFDSKVLALNGRTQDSRRVRGLYKAIEASGIPNIAAEMMCGLKGQTEAAYLKDIATIIKWKPGRIFLFDYQPCEKLRDSCAYTKERGLDVHKMWNSAAELVKKAGYHVHGHFATIDQGGRNWPDSFDNTMAGESIIGLGAGAISHVFAKCRYQNAVSVGEYLAKIRAGELPVGAGVRLSVKDNMRYLLLDSFESVSGRIDIEEFRKLFGRRPDEVFKKEFEHLLEHKVLAKIDDSYCVCDLEKATFELQRCFYGRDVTAALKAKFAEQGKTRIFQSINPRVDARPREEEYVAPVNLTGTGDSDKMFLRSLLSVTGRGQNRLALIVNEKNLSKARVYADAAMKRLIKNAWLVYSSDKPAKVSAAIGAGRCFSRFYAVCAENSFKDFLIKWSAELARLKSGGLEPGIIFAVHKGNCRQLKTAFTWAQKNKLADFMILQPCLRDKALLGRIGGEQNVMSIDEVAGEIGRLGLKAGLKTPSLTSNHLPLCSKAFSEIKKIISPQELLDICGDRKIKSSGCLNCVSGDACEGVDVSYSRHFEVSGELFRETAEENK